MATELSKKDELMLRIGFSTDWVTLDQMAKRVEGKLKEVSMSVGKSAKLVPSKGGFQADSFLNIDTLSSQIDMFGKKIDSGFSSSMNKVKQKTLDVNKVILAEEKAFSRVQNVIAKQDAIYTKLSSTKLGSLFGKEKGFDIAKDQKSQQAYFDSIYGNINRVSNAAKKAQTPFAGWAMSIMFAGMAMQRMVSQLYTFGTKAFNEISHSVEGTVTQSDLLEGSMKYLGYTIGEALQPVIEWLIPIVDKIAELVEENPKLTAGFIVLSAILGTLAFVGGSVVLAFNGIKDAIMLAFGTDITALLTKHGGVLGVLKAGYLALKTEIIATGVAIKAMSLASLVGLLGIVTGIVLAVVWIYKLQDAMGGWGEFFKSVARGVLRAIVLLAEGFVWLGDMIMTGVFSVINLLIRQINKLLESEVVQWGAEKLGVSVSAIDEIGGSQYQFGDALLRKYLDWEQNSALAPSQGYATGGGMTPTYNINTVNINNPQDMDEILAKLKQG